MSNGDAGDKTWVGIYRVLLKKAIWLNSTPEQKCILITIILCANHAENEWEWNGRPYLCKPGEFVTSLESLRKKTGKGISIQNVRTSIARFKKLKFLTIKPTNQNSLVSIIDTEICTLLNMANQQTNQQTPNKRLTTNNNDYNDNNIYNGKFEEFWKIYPKRNGKKIGKKDCLEWVNKNIKSENELQKIIAAAGNYAVSKTARDGYAKDPIRFLKKDYWQEWQEPETNIPGPGTPVQQKRSGYKEFKGY